MKIDYIELSAHDLDLAKQFFSEAFGWAFTDYGPEYTAFFRAEAGLDGGIFKSDPETKPRTGALVIFYSNDLERAMQKITDAGGTVVKPTFLFPGGRRFHFCDPCGNEYALWSDVDASGQKITQE